MSEEGINEDREVETHMKEGCGHILGIADVGCVTLDRHDVGHNVLVAL